MNNPKWWMKRQYKRLRVFYLSLRDGKRCRYCTCDLVQAHKVRAKAPNGWVDTNTWSRRLTLDHIVPKSRGGSNQLSNLCLSCATCNTRKGSMSATAFICTDKLQQRRASIEAERARADSHS